MHETRVQRQKGVSGRPSRSPWRPLEDSEGQVRSQPDSKSAGQLPRSHSPQKPPIHPGHHTGRMPLRQMGVPLDHGQGLVPHGLRQFGQRGLTHADT